MIQRIQTLWLLLAGAVCVLQLMFPMIKVDIQPLSLFLPVVLLNIAAGSSLIFALLSIFWFKKRKQQQLWCYGIILLQILVYICIGWFFHRFTQGVSVSHLEVVYYPFAFPAIVIIFTVLAITGIRKDEKKVRDADRLR